MRRILFILLSLFLLTANTYAVYENESDYYEVNCEDDCLNCRKSSESKDPPVIP